MASCYLFCVLSGLSASIFHFTWKHGYTHTNKREEKDKGENFTITCELYSIHRVVSSWHSYLQWTEDTGSIPANVYYLCLSEGFPFLLSHYKPINDFVSNFVSTCTLYTLYLLYTLYIHVNIATRIKIQINRPNFGLANIFLLQPQLKRL